MGVACKRVLGNAPVRPGLATRLGCRALPAVWGEATRRSPRPRHERALDQHPCPHDRLGAMDVRASPRARRRLAHTEPPHPGVTRYVGLGMAAAPPSRVGGQTGWGAARHPPTTGPPREAPWGATDRRAPREPPGRVGAVVETATGMSPRRDGAPTPLWGRTPDARHGSASAFHTPRQPTDTRCAKPNAGPQAPPMAGARDERRLLAVACRPMLGQGVRVSDRCRAPTLRRAQATHACTRCILQGSTKWSLSRYTCSAAQTSCPSARRVASGTAATSRA